MGNPARSKIFGVEKEGMSGDKRTIVALIQIQGVIEKQ